MSQCTDTDGPVAVAVSTGEILRHPAAGTHLLNEQERGRLTRFCSEQAARDFLAAHVLARFCAGWLLGVAPAEVPFAQRCPRCHGTDHGRPLLVGRPDVHVSLSHAKGVVAAVAGRVSVGIDVELLGRAQSLKVMDRALTAAERALVTAEADPSRAFLRQWVRKEALIKVGRTHLGALSSLDLSELPLDDRADGTPLRFEDFYLTDLTDSRLGALVAAAGAQPVRLGAGLPSTTLGHGPVA
ncbi:holo-(acyl carrier protein) synthase 2 [Streptomyces sp. ADI92-24]|uniref:4'-phosphopantetheinyl transferase family protein n=1 Tax=unclassified Streptomyces TaxID=2593676 RepID=UPI000F4AC972|nr:MULTISPECIES: 4'-phosphopantetheinyl transferase superfamily protein [unclassified Streptomyces]MCX4775243.1 4'-phosphopantetheinyl transferase superfamily protein [Streptomyces sp. NBC_01285]ROQ65342.1 4'-phosphopantetheinyl transferase [Streptomyces sp. CEV 2-1]RPK33063.1 holo-(acyl carrier protein) synthase 2 [Streptomyces sp. ADI92-24]